MKSIYLLTILLITTLTSCFAPINLTFDSARTLDKGEVQVQGNYSKYLYYYGSDSENNNSNFGGRIDYGVSDKYNLKFRYEKLYSKNEFYELLDINKQISLNYIEVESKIQLIPNQLAVGLPIGYYFGNKNISEGLTVIDPRIYITMFSKSNTFELSIIPKCHVFIDKKNIIPFPALSIGLGLSNDLKKWALRPEVGFDTNFSFGIGVNYNIGWR